MGRHGIKKDERTCSGLNAVQSGEGFGPILEISHLLLRGGNEWDHAHDGHVPVLIVDGRETAWKNFGRMRMRFKGWQFQLKIRDQREEF